MQSSAGIVTWKLRDFFGANTPESRRVFRTIRLAFFARFRAGAAEKLLAEGEPLTAISFKDCGMVGG